MNRHRQAQWSDDVIAKRNVEWEDGSDGKAVLLVPRFRKGMLAKWVQPRLKKPYIRVALDDIGSFVWKNMDGVKTFGDLVVDMRLNFGKDCEPADERLKKFFIMLYKNEFITLYTAS